ncbi:MAG: hypothetical protein WBP93_21560, partial [Pyrinomonadaceae bacterium]
LKPGERTQLKVEAQFARASAALLSNNPAARTKSSDSLHQLMEKSDKATSTQAVSDGAAGASESRAPTGLQPSQD